MSRYENLNTSMSHIMYANFIYPAAYVIEGSAVQKPQWGITKAHAAYRAQKAVRKATGETLPIYKSIKHYNREATKRRAAREAAAK